MPGFMTGIHVFLASIAAASYALDANTAEMRHAMGIGPRWRDRQYIVLACKGQNDAGHHDSLGSPSFGLSNLKLATVQRPTPKAGKIQTDKFRNFRNTS
jgi:hypothetical protein